MTSLCYPCKVRQHPMTPLVLIYIILHKTCKHLVSRQLLLPNIISSVYVCGDWPGALNLIWARRRTCAHTPMTGQYYQYRIDRLAGHWLRLWTMLWPAAKMNCVGRRRPQIASLWPLRCCSLLPQRTYGTQRPQIDSLWPLKLSTKCLNLTNILANIKPRCTENYHRSMGNTY